MRRRQRENLAWAVGGYVLGRGPVRTLRQLASALPFLAGGALLAYAFAASWWAGLGILGRALVALVLLAVLAVFLLPQARAWLPLPPPRTPGSGPLPRTVAPWYSVYVITEWRDADGFVLPRTLPTEPAPAGAIRHLVYIGKATTLDDRMEDHMRERPWFHDQLMFDVVRCGSDREALDVEARMIADAARSARPEDWPRENAMLNPRFPADMSRRAFLLGQARRSPGIRPSAV